MSTRCIIIAKNENKPGYSAIYCHNDGYINGVGKLLFEHYTDPAKVAKLITLGDISSLGERIDPIGPHTFEHRENGTTTAYGRDRGEKGCEARTALNPRELEESGYIYFFDGSTWYYGIPCTLAELVDNL